MKLGEERGGSIEWEQGALNGGTPLVNGRKEKSKGFD